MFSGYFKRFIFYSLALLLISFLKWNLISLFRYFNLSVNIDNAAIIYKVFITAQWFVAAFLARQVMCFIFDQKFFTKKDTSLKPKLVKDLLSILIFFVTAAIVLNKVFEQPLTGIWVTSGALAITLGFALRNIILDIFSGVAVNIENPYRIGDWIEIHQRFSHTSIIGKVMEINWRSTHIQTEQNTNVVIPNSLITTMSVTTNFWYGTKPTRYEVEFTFDFSIAHQRVKRILMSGAMEAYENLGFVKEQPPQIIILETNELGVVYQVRYWINPWQHISPSIAKDHLQSCILNHLTSAGVTLAYPKEDVYHNPMPERHLDSDNENDRTRLLAQNELFSMLTDTELKELSSKMIRHLYKANQSVVKEGDQGNSMFILFEGFLEVSIGEGASELTVATLTPLNYFGEMSLLTGESRSANIRCVTDSIVYEIKQIHFNELIVQRDEIIEQIAVNISKRRAKNTAVLIEEKERSSALTADEFKTSLIRKIKNIFGVRI